MDSVTNLLDQCRHRTTVVFGNLGRCPDRVTYYEQDYPYTIIFEPNFGVHIPRSFGKTVIVFTSHLDLTWDKGAELRFFQVGRPPSDRVWDAYQPQTTDALICSCQCISSRSQASAHRILHCHDSQGWQRSRSDLHHHESCRTNFQAQRFSIQLPRECPSSSGTPPVTQECARGIHALCVRGKFSQLAQGNKGLMVIKGVEQENFFKSSDYLLWPWRRCRNSKTFAMEPFRTPCMRVCTRKRTFRAAPW
ncbi:uncharacterized protein TNCV_2383241 [Trichonephila clavipes]|nr:uncharacterized protein TNCV_2383241 [Trichonephila clavipes]